MGCVTQRWVISLPDASTRREAFFAQAPSSGFEVFPAVDLRGTWPAVWADRFDVDEFVARYGRRPAPGEVGCVLSHLSLIAQLATTLADADWALVCEDDAVFQPGAEAVVAARQPRRFDLIAVGMGGPDLDRRQPLLPLSPWARPIPGAPHVLGVQWPSAWAGTVGYLISGTGARVMHRVASRQRASWVADDLTFWHDQGLAIAGVRPVIIHEDLSHPSAIGNDTRDELRRDQISRPRHLEFAHSRRRRQRVWFAAEEVRTRLPALLRHRLPLRALPALDRWVNRAWRG